MNFKKGFKVRPSSINSSGAVLFTDGEVDGSGNIKNEFMPSEMACKAYGYTYENGVCSAFVPSMKLRQDQTNDNNSLTGDNNTANNSRGTLITGSKNISIENINCSVSGQNHRLESQENNASIIGGSYGYGSHTGEVIIGGGSFESNVGEIQTSIFHVSRKTTDATESALYINGDTEEQTQIFVPANSICIYEIYLTALCYGGSAGTAGHYKTEKHLGSILKENDNSQTLVSSSVTAISSSGTTGSAAIDVTDGDVGMTINVTGTRDVNIQWSATVYLYINKTNAVEI